MAKKEKEEEEETKEVDITGYDQGNNGERESIWQVVCFTQQDWSRLVDKFKDSVSISSLTFSKEIIKNVHSRNLT